ncbi:MAG: hypothetical protein V4640_10650 [Verrucomicrobiota bacterium]
MNLTVFRKVPPCRGFALVVTLSLMILLTVIAVGLLSLSSISLRSVSGQAANSIARANARMAMMMALGELQKAAGDDRRITADASIANGAQNPNVVGVWKSWSPNLATNPLSSTAPNYAAEKDTNFVAWLTSSNNPSEMVGNKEWGNSGTLTDPIELFTPKSDGFSLSGSKIEVSNGKSSSAGGMAWTIVQDATRAKINVDGPEDNQRELNDDLQAQARPSLAISESFKQPDANWNQRATRVVSMAQAKLDADLWKGGTADPENAHFTSQGFGLLTDVVNGGLKTDLSLGFEMSDSNFTANSWGTYKNPFRSVNFPQLPVSSVSSYGGQRPLFRPLVRSGSVRVNLNFGMTPNPSFDYPAAAVPTFATLRSFYRTPYYLYDTADGATVFERGMDSVSLTRPIAANITTPGSPPPATSSQTGYRPVLDRMIYVLSAGLGADNKVRLIITPLVTLWNPYNVALEIEGAVAYPWLDFPFKIKWTFSGTTHGIEEKSLSLLVGPGRSVNPYFFASITPNGSATVTPGQSIRFKPGEVRTFAPANLVDFPLVPVASQTGPSSNTSRTFALKPVDNPNMFSVQGGIAVSMTGGHGFDRTMRVGDSVQVEVSPSGANDYPFSVGLEDATRIRPGGTNNSHGQVVSDVQTINFTQTASSATATMRYPRSISYTQLRDPKNRLPFGMIETYHRVAGGGTSSRKSDLVFTVNPRQPFINRYLSTGTFLAGPHYETRMQEISSISNLIQTSGGGRSAYYGATNEPIQGKTQLSFFEVPQALPLSLSAFQHADLSGTSYSTAYQAGNSWASAYLPREAVAQSSNAVSGVGSREANYNRAQMPIYDYSYLVNETLWDSFYFSGASPKVSPGTASGRPSIWTGSNVANVTGSYQSVLTDFIEDPVAYPLRNPRMRFHPGSSKVDDLKVDLVKPEGCLKLAAHLCVDGAFNINSTSEKAWIAFLSGMRDRSFKVVDEAGRVISAPTGGKTAFPRFRDPLGTDTDNWMGFRAMSDGQIAELAQQIVIEVKKRGPFLSLAEFVNRRVEGGELGLKGAIQTAIDATDSNNFNQGAHYEDIDISRYPGGGTNNIIPRKTGVGIPGYLTQADVLQSIAPTMTARSDTFTIRSYGEAKDASGRILSAVWCETVVQRMPEFVDETNPPYATIAELNPINQTFGRKFSIVSFRYLNPQELVL